MTMLRNITTALLRKGEAIVFMTVKDGHPVADIRGNLEAKDDITFALMTAGFYKYNADKLYPWLAKGRRGWKASKAEIKKHMNGMGYQAEDYGDENVIYKHYKHNKHS